MKVAQEEEHQDEMMKVAEEEEYPDEIWIQRVKDAEPVFRPNKFGEVSRWPRLETILEEDEDEEDELDFDETSEEDSTKSISFRFGCDIKMAWPSEESLVSMKYVKTAWASTESINEEEEREVVRNDKTPERSEEDGSAETTGLPKRKWWIPKFFRKTNRTKVRKISDYEEELNRPSKLLRAFLCCFSTKT
ncbi:uncharacterized protein LOC143783413 [Ranitomeya variabilis]|uniref:uncharacterized protein LOC143783413 n=1 Tax=Ranitomeya variabilis TaxID=490064 RepID=UPI004055BC6E